MKKKVIAILAALMLVFSFVSCTNEPEGEDTNGINTPIEGPIIPWDGIEG